MSNDAQLTNEWMRAPLASGRVALVCFFRMGADGRLEAIERQPTLSDLEGLLEYLRAAAKILSAADCPDGDDCPDAALHPRAG
jgi:hypothetical protein